MIKKRLLFVIESLVCAGAEKSLVTLLNLIDYSKYDVDLQLFSYGGEFECMLPVEVNLLPSLRYFQETRKSLKSYVSKRSSLEEWRMLRGRLAYSIALRTSNYNNPQKAVLFWKHTHQCFDVTEKTYDVAIAYAQGTPTFYVADCVKAAKKFAWVNVTYRPDGKYRNFVSEKYASFDKICCVSDSAYEVFREVFPERANKGTILYDINDGGMIRRMSEMSSPAVEEMKNNGYTLLTIGRLAPQKGYEIALKACKCLKDREIDFKWYALGRGPLEDEITKKIAEYGLEQYFVLLGTRANPYPYIKKADIYVQTSRLEGYGLAIAEARMLNTPVVTTRFDAVYAQMIEGENGLVVDMDGEAVADGIHRLMNDPKLYEHIVEFQKTEKKGNYEELDKFYALIES